MKMSPIIRWISNNKSIINQLFSATLSHWTSSTGCTGQLLDVDYTPSLNK